MKKNDFEMLKSKMESLLKITPSEDEESRRKFQEEVYHNNLAKSSFVHESAFVDKDVTIGDNTKIWHFSHGSGINRIKKFCLEHNIVEPKFEEKQKGFKVTLYKKILENEVNEGVSEGVKSLYVLIAEKPNHRSTFFAEQLQTSVKNIERWLKQLKDEELIEFLGASKTGGYFVK